MSNLTVNGRSEAKKFDIKQWAIYFIMLGIFIVFAIFLRERGFLSLVNLMNIFRQTAIISIMAVGFTFMLASGEFDLSIGSTVALSALVGALMLQRAGIALAIFAAVAVGATVGFANGFFVVKAKMPSILATIAMMGIIHGFARWITHLQAVPVINDRFTYTFGGGNVGPIPTLFIWTLVVMVIGHIAMVNTLFGRKVLAIGGNQAAARLSGINVSRVKWLLFMIMGMISSLSGLLYSGRLHAARYTYGEQDLFTIVAAVVIGGNSIYGGTGTIIGAVVGSIIIGMVNNGLILFGFSVDQQVIFRGVIILIAVALSPKGPKE
ncbi:MAG: ABC transporter permease [Spirochaetota bacterium]|nr:MAG: ABC transporter permease [Spirochaetota bacterium]